MISERISFATFNFVVSYHHLRTKKRTTINKSKQTEGQWNFWSHSFLSNVTIIIITCQIPNSKFQTRIPVSGQKMFLFLFFNSSRCLKFNKSVPSLKNVNGNVKFCSWFYAANPSWLDINCFGQWRGLHLSGDTHKNPVLFLATIKLMLLWQW